MIVQDHYVIGVARDALILTIKKMQNITILRVQLVKIVQNS